ncbi:MAG TPA: acetyl-CoA carboxylase biotin carboxyl carrier protein subunit [Gaiellaceae bacterium]
MSDGPDLTPEDVKEILRLIDESRFDEFELETPRFSVRFSRGGGEPSAAPAPQDVVPGSALVDVTAPMVGTIYRFPSPGEPPFVEVGAHVEAGAQLCIIEVMKLMHAVTATESGTIAEVCVENGAAVQYGDVLFRMRADD